MSLRLEAGGRKFVAAVSHAPYDSLRELIEGLSALLEGRPSVVIRWNREPEEFDLVFEAEGDEVRLEIVRYPDHRRLSRKAVFSARLSKLDLCRAFWRELRQLRMRKETDVFEQNWRRAFPEEELRRLTKALRDFRKSGVAAPPARA